MTTTLIVLAHPDNRSFNGAWANTSAQAALALGHTVLESDLCALGFDAVENRLHYPEWNADRSFDPLKAQEEITDRKGLPADVQAEVEKLQQADHVIFHFPIWWFAPPAVLKGWFDRVLVHGDLHSIDQRFDRGKFKSKSVLFCVTTGASKAESAYNGKEGDVDMLLWPTAFTLRYLGFTIRKPEVVHGVHGYHEGDDLINLESRLRSVLDAQKGLIAALNSRAQIPFNKDTDFDETGKLRKECPSESYFIRHSK